VYGSCFGDGMVDDVQINKQTEYSKCVLDRAKGLGRVERYIQSRVSSGAGRG